MPLPTIMHPGSWFSREGLYEAQGKAHAACVLKTMAKVLSTIKKTILPWRKPLSRGKELMLGCCWLMPTTLLLHLLRVSNFMFSFLQQFTQGM